METITEVFRLDVPSIILGLLLIMYGLKAFISIAEWVVSKFGIEIKWLRKTKYDKTLLYSTVQRVKELKDKHEADMHISNVHDIAIEEKLAELRKMFIDKQVDDIRYEILDFSSALSSALSSGRIYSKEQFDHVIKLYEKYEKILEENELTNGQVTASMEVIYDVYKEKLKNGF